MAIKQYVTFRPVLSINIPNTGEAGADNKYINPEIENIENIRNRDQENELLIQKMTFANEIVLVEYSTINEVGFARTHIKFFHEENLAE